MKLGTFTTSTGAAHIGVLKVLERERIPVHVITGASVGAIIGGLYSAGYSPEEIETIITSIDWIDIFRDETARPAAAQRARGRALLPSLAQAA